MNKLFLAVAALLGYSVAQADEDIKVGYIAFTSHAPSMIAKERGYFAEEGLNPELIRFQAAQPMAVAIASGDIDYGVTAITGGLLNLAARGDAVRIIGGALREEPGVEGQKILASKQAYDAGLTSPAKLDGKRFAVTNAGSSFDYMGKQIAAKEGLGDNSLQIVPMNGVPAIIAALQSGQVDAWSIVPNIASGLVKKGAAVEIGKVADYLPDYQVTVLFTSKDNVEQHPEQVAAFKQAFARGPADYNAALVDGNSDDSEKQAVIDIIHQYVYTERSPEDAAKAIAAGAMRIAPDAVLSREDVIRQIDWFKAQGLVPNSLDANTLIAE